MTRAMVAAGTALAVLVAVLLGPAGLGVITYRVSGDATAQYVGGEFVTLVAALVLVGGAIWRESRAWLVAQLGAASYLIYTMVTVVFGQEYARFAGNGERFFLLFVVVTTGSIFVATGGVSRLLKGAELPSSRAARTTLVVVGVGFALLWLQGIVANYVEPTAEYLDSPNLFWLVKYLDLALIVPVALVCASRWRASHRVGGAVVLAFSAWMMAAICAMQIAMIVLRQAPIGLLGVAAVMAAGAVWCGVLVVRWAARTPCTA